jgi:RimJ/RimL family protein N-acetyltransferase
MNLLPLDQPILIELAANWLGREENYKWLDFGEGAHALSVMSLRIMTQRDLHVLRVFTPDDSDLPIGLVALSDIRRQSKTAGSVWMVLGRKRYAGYAARAVSQLLTLGFDELGLEAVSAWAVETNVASRRVLEQLRFRYVGRQRRWHWIDGRPYDRLLYDLLATEHREITDTPVHRSEAASTAAAHGPSWTLAKRPRHGPMPPLGAA